jgi:hypothetical protein
VNANLEADEKRIEDALLKLTEKNQEYDALPLAEQVSQTTQIPRYKVARTLYRLIAEGKLKLQDQRPPIKLNEYLQSTHALWFWATIGTLTITAITIYALPQDAPYIYLRYILGSVFVLFLPGYMLIEALYPKPKDLEPLERLALSIGLSLALVPLTGLLLNYTPWGIRLNPILISLTLITGLLALVAAVRKLEKS